MPPSQSRLAAGLGHREDWHAVEPAAVPALRVGTDVRWGGIAVQGERAQDPPARRNEDHANARATSARSVQRLPNLILESAAMRFDSAAGCERREELAHLGKGNIAAPLARDVVEREPAREPLAWEQIDSRPIASSRSAPARPRCRVRAPSPPGAPTVGRCRAHSRAHTALLRRCPVDQVRSRLSRIS